MNPVAFSIFGFNVMWYGILIALGAFIGVFIGDKLVEREGLKKNSASDFLIIALIPSIIGARLYYVIFEWDYYRQNLGKIFAIREGGLAIYGGIISGFIIAYFFCKKRNIKFKTFLDCLAPGLVFAQGLGRWGNFINGEAHGGPTNLPWAIMVDGVRVHPTFLYESLVDVGLSLFLFFYLSKNKKFQGQVFATYLIVYGIARFFIEGLRTDSLYLGQFRISQLVSLVIILLGLIVYIKRSPETE